MEVRTRRFANLTGKGRNLTNNQIMAELQNKKMQLMEIEEANKQLRIALMEAKKASQVVRRRSNAAESF